MLSWDNTARKGANSHVFERFSLGAYQNWHSLNLTRTMLQYNTHSGYPPITFINAWNEWAEGSHLEPDQRFGYSSLNATYHASQIVSGSEDDIKLIANRNDPRITQAPRQTAVIIHCYYIDLYQDYIDRLSCALNLDSVDIYITTDTLEKAVAIRSISPSATIDVLPNIGRDIRPFLHILASISENGLCYQSCLKLHTKKSLYRPDGSELRERLLNSLLARSTVDKALSEIKYSSDIGLICPKDAMIEHLDPNGDRLRYNFDNIQYLCGKIGIDFEPSWFPAGSMFWFSQPCFFPLNALKKLAWEPEIGLVDGTFAHAVERIFAVLVEKQKKLVLSVTP
jgi:lipopolysaccharide biosynthesis protein